VDPPGESPRPPHSTPLAAEYTHQPNKAAVTAEPPPYFSYDNVSWQPVTDFTYDLDTPKLILRLAPTHDRVWIAHIPPYTNAHLARLAEWETLGLEEEIW